MRTWSLTAKDIRSYRLAADGRQCVPDYVNDQIWELALGGGDPPALSLWTSYGLRARSMRIFSGFALDERYVADPEAFATPPEVCAIYPSYLRLRFHPFEDIEVGAEFWVPDSQRLAGRYLVNSQSPSLHAFRLVVYGVLRPGDNPKVMSAGTYDGVTVLRGQTGDLVPVVFMAGGAGVQQAPFPGLAVTFDLEPGSSKAVLWSHAALGDEQASFAAARSMVAKVWDGEIAKLEMVNASLVEVETGSPQWDLAFHLSQKVALGSYVGPTRHLPHASFILSRMPDKGYSERGDGRDYSLHWDGQTAFHAYLNLPQILPAAPELAKGVIRNFLATQQADGSLDSKPGLGGQRSGRLCPPLLGTLAWRIYQGTDDRPFLEECFPRLMEFAQAWFSPAHDRDQDGHPEWDHTIHAGFDDWPTFVRWQAWGQGLDITKAETPDLASYLYRECQSLIEAARLLGKPEEAARLAGWSDRLRQAVEASWSDESACYRHVDRDAHQSPAGEVLGKGEGQFVLDVGRRFDPPVRVLVRSKGAEGQSHAVQVHIQGRGPQGRSRLERLTERDFQWFWDRGTATSDKAYAEISRVEIRGLSKAFSTEVLLADYTRQDQSLLLPLWAGIPSQEGAERLVHETLMDPDRFWRPFGIPACSAQDPAYAPDNRQGSGGVWMLWNTMLGEGLVDYGFIESVAELVGRLMEAVVHSLNADGAFREAYNADQAEGLGERDHMAGVAPLSLFLSTLGVRLISPRKVWLAGHNPYPWPVTVRWRGLEIRRVPDGPTSVIFPDGQRLEVVGEQARLVEQVG